MGKTVEFMYDFVSVPSFIAWKALPPMLEAVGAQMVLTPVLVGGIFKATGNQPPFSAYAGIKGKMDYEMLEIRRFIAAHGLTRFRMNPHFPVNSLTAMRGLCAVEPGADFYTYVEAVLAGFWEQGLAMGDASVLSSVLTEAGLDAEAILARAQTDPVKAVLAANTEAAVARGTFGIPTFFVDDEMVFGKERLGQVEVMVA